MSWPASTGSGASDLLATRAALVLTLVVADPVVVADAVLLPTGEADVVVAVSVMLVRTGVPAFTFFFNDTATTEIYALSLHDALPISVPPATTKSVRVQPAGVVVETNVVLAGVASDIVTVCASLGPLLISVTV